MSSMSELVESLFGIIEAGWTGYQLGGSNNEFEAYTHALNLLGATVASTPFGIGINSAAAANNTTVAVSKWTTGTLQPSDIAQITGSILAIGAGVAALTTIELTFPVLLLAGAVSILAGPGSNAFNEGAAKISDLLLNNPSETDSGGKLTIRQYSINGSEFFSHQITNSAGLSFSEVAQLSGDAGKVLGYELPPVRAIIGNDDAISFPDIPLIDGVPTVDLNDAIPIMETTYDLTKDQVDDAVNFIREITSKENSLEYTQDLLNSIGKQGDTSFVLPGSLFDIYNYSVRYFIDHDYAALMDPWTFTYDVPDYVMNFHDLISNQGYIYGAVGYDSMYWYLESKLGESDYDQWINFISNEYSLNGSPIVIDLNGDGVHTIARSNSIANFDINDDGIKDITGWLSGSDGFVAYDKNKNGTIDNVSELFGGIERGVGYQELSMFDSNNDNFIDLNDAKYSDLSIWKDTNQNAITDDGELTPIWIAGVEQLALTYEMTQHYEKGNMIGERSYAILNGARQQMADVYFSYIDGETYQHDGPIMQKARFHPAETNKLAANITQASALFSTDESFSKPSHAFESSYRARLEIQVAL